MDTTTRLIMWQRLTIAALLLATMTMTLAAGHHARMSESHLQDIQDTQDIQHIRRWQEESQRWQQRTVERGGEIRQLREARKQSDLDYQLEHDFEQQVIHDLDRQLFKYEARYGILPREGIGRYILPGGAQNSATSLSARDARR